MKNDKFLATVYDFASILLTAVLAVSIIFAFFFKISAVVGSSMADTLSNGDRVLITSINTSLKYGDVVVISQPNSLEKVLIKRIIAVGGQEVSFDRENGKVIVDGTALDEPYIKEFMDVYDSFDKTYRVPEGMLFVMGDNRNDSLDSRDARVGFIDERYIVGKVFYRMWDTHFFNEEFENG